jgi:hypothetical protein
MGQRGQVLRSQARVGRKKLRPRSINSALKLFHMSTRTSHGADLVAGHRRPFGLTAGSKPAPAHRGGFCLGGIQNRLGVLGCEPERYPKVVRLTPGRWLGFFLELVFQKRNEGQEGGFVWNKPINWRFRYA